jgi:hypothetical protein
VNTGTASESSALLGGGLRVSSEQVSAWGPRFASENDYAFETPSYALVNDGQQVGLPGIVTTSLIDAVSDAGRVVSDWDPEGLSAYARGPLPTDVPLAGLGDEFLSGYRDPRGLNRTVMQPETTTEAVGRYGGAAVNSLKNFAGDVTGVNNMNAAQASWRAGNYGTSLLQEATAFTEAGMTVLSPRRSEKRSAFRRMN